jgi:hypothetical protein
LQPTKTYARPKPPSLTIFEEQKEFVKVPRFWLDELMPLATSVPASFWKFLLVLWRNVMNGNAQLANKLSIQQFEISKTQAVKWKAALSVSGLFTVTTGTWVPRNSSLYAYRKDATIAEWVCFVKALNKKLEEDKDSRMDPSLAVAFGIELAGYVDNERTLAHLDAVNEEFIRGCVADGIATQTEYGVAATGSRRNPRAWGKA